MVKDIVKNMVDTDHVIIMTNSATIEKMMSDIPDGDLYTASFTPKKKGITSVMYAGKTITFIDRQFIDLEKVTEGVENF